MIDIMGQRIGLSILDVARLNAMYECPDKPRRIIEKQ